MVNHTAKSASLLDEGCTCTFNGHFLEAGHKGIEDMRVMIIDKTNVNEPTNREGFWAYKLIEFVYTSGTQFKRFYINI